MCFLFPRETVPLLITYISLWSLHLHLPLATIALPGPRVQLIKKYEIVWQLSIHQKSSLPACINSQVASQPTQLNNELLCFPGPRFKYHQSLAVNIYISPSSIFTCSVPQKQKYYYLKNNVILYPWLEPLYEMNCVGTVAVTSAIAAIAATIP